MMKDDINLPLRSAITEIALKVEQTINSILLIYLSIENEDRKAITNKSGNLSFKNKIDLLFDLEILSKEEHKRFLLLMEFRNQFLHNIECNSFLKAVLVLGPDKGKSLLKFYNGKGGDTEEVQYNSAFINLYKRNNSTALEKIRARKQLIKEKAELINGLTSDNVTIIESFFELYYKLSDKYMPNSMDSQEVLALKTQILDIVGNDLMAICNSKEYKSLFSNLDNSLTTDKIKTYFFDR